MPFIPGDKNINRKGVIPKEDRNKYTAKELKQKEVMSLLRKLKPLMSKSIGVASNIIDDKDATESGKLRSAALLLGFYKDLLKEAYDQEIKTEPSSGEGESSAEGIDTSKNAPVFSLTMLKPEPKEE